MNWRTFECDFCPQLAATRTQVVVATPCRQGGLLVIGEAPGNDEDTNGIGFVGAAGKALRTLLHEENLSSPDYGVANICRCRPCDSQGKNRPPTAAEVGHCLPYLGSLIRAVRPKVILAVGSDTAANEIFGFKGVEEQISFGREKGWKADEICKGSPEAIRESLQFVSYIVPMPHTSPVNSRKAHKVIAKKQVQIAVELLRLKGKKRAR